MGFLFLQRENNSHLVVSIVTGYGLDDEGSIPGRNIDFSLHHHVQISSDTHLASFPVGTRGSEPGDKVTGT
jgi:hypothetical protein